MPIRSPRDKTRVGPKPSSIDEVPRAFQHFPPKLLKWLQAFPGCCILPLLFGHTGMLVMQVARELGIGERRGALDRLRGWLKLLVERQILIASNNPDDTREHLYSCLRLDEGVITWLKSQWTRVREQVRTKRLAAEKRVVTLQLREQVLDKTQFPRGSSNGR